MAWVQIDEPAIVTGLTAEEVELLGTIYREIAAAVPGLHVLLQTYFEAAEPLEALLELPVQGIGLDFVHDGRVNLASIRRPAGRTTNGWERALSTGAIFGAPIWMPSLSWSAR